LGYGLASRFEITYGPDVDIDRITRGLPATTLAALFTVIGQLMDNPFPGKSAADVTRHFEKYLAVFDGGILAYSVSGRTITLVSLILL
jgi:hypothetical protein